MKPSDLALHLPARIWGYISVVQGGCWEPSRFDNGNGYRRVWIAGRLQYLHRVTYEALVGPIPEGLTVDHVCRNRACCNPAHLEPVSDEDNRARGVSPPTRNARKPACPECRAPYSFRSDGTRYCRPCRRRVRAAAGETKGGLPMAQRTHCPQGHPYDEENTMIVKHPNGTFKQRACRACVNARQRRGYARRIAAQRDREAGDAQCP